MTTRTGAAHNQPVSARSSALGRHSGQHAPSRPLSPASSAGSTPATPAPAAAPRTRAPPRAQPGGGANRFSRRTPCRADKTESSCIPMSLRLGSTANVFLPVRLSPPICRRGYPTDYWGRLYGPVNPARNGGQRLGKVIWNVYTTLGHAIIRLPGYGVPKAAAAQGNSGRRAPSRPALPGGLFPCLCLGPPSGMVRRSRDSSLRRSRRSSVSGGRRLSGWLRR